MKIILIVLVLLSGCGSDTYIDIYTVPSLKDTDWSYSPGEEQTPVVWNDRLLIVMFQRPLEVESFVQIIDFETKEIVTSVQTPGRTIGSAIVANGRLYLFAITGLDLVAGGIGSTGNSIVMIESQDLKNWSEPMIVYTATPGTFIWNTSVAPSPNGYILAYDFSTSTAESSPSQARFIESSNLISWKDVPGTLLGANGYFAAVTIRYSNGYYYAAYTQSYHNKSGYYLTNVVSRSVDLNAWELAPYALASPVGDRFDQYSATDADLAEFNGKTYVIYSTGPQSHIDKQMLRSKICDCSMDKLFLSAFSGH